MYNRLQAAGGGEFTDVTRKIPKKEQCWRKQDYERGAYDPVTRRKLSPIIYLQKTRLSRICFIALRYPFFFFFFGYHRSPLDSQTHISQSIYDIFQAILV